MGELTQGKNRLNRHYVGWVMPSQWKRLFFMNILVRPLREPDLPVADRIFRLAFGTFNGLPDPLQYGGDSDKIRTRWLADPAAAFGAEVDGALVGSNFVTHWGSVGYFGPLTVHPDFWDRGVAQKLLEPALALFETWGCRHTGLYTYSGSPKHLALYQKFGFWPRSLTAILSKAVRPVERVGEVSLYSQAPGPAAPRTGGRGSRAHRRHLCRAGREPGDFRP